MNITGLNFALLTFFVCFITIPFFVDLTPEQEIVESPVVYTFQEPQQPEQQQPAFQQATLSLYKFGPNNDPGVQPADLNMRDYPPPYWNYSEVEWKKMQAGGIIVISHQYINAVASNLPNGHYPL